MDKGTKQRFREIMDNAERVVFFGGAGVPVASGFPDFGGNGGLYTSGAGHIPPEDILSHRYMLGCPTELFGYYRNNTLYPAASAVGYCRGKRFIMNKSRTSYDGCAERVIRKPIDEVSAETVWGNDE